MLALIPLVLLVGTICGAFYYLLSKRGLAAEERKNPESQRRVSLLTETVAYVGALLVLAGVGVAAGQGWSGITDWGHAGIFASIAMFFLAIGLVVLWITDPAIQRMLGVVWFLSAGCAGAAAGIAAHDVYGSSGAITALLTGLTITAYSAFLWLIRRRWEPLCPWASRSPCSVRSSPSGTNPGSTRSPSRRRRARWLPASRYG